MSDSLEFGQFSEAVDLHNLSHRALVQTLIPDWMEAGWVDLDQRIAGAAYGETPPDLQNAVLEILCLQPGERFLDLGAGGGGFVASLLASGVEAHGIEQNPLLVEAGRRFFQLRGWPESHLIQDDFLTCQWPEAEVVYAANTRFGDEVLERLAERLEERTTLRAVACLGKPLPLPANWKLIADSSRQVQWNKNEQPLRERLLCWAKCSIT